MKYLVVFLTAVGLLSACVAPSQRGDVYNSSQSRRMQQVKEGVILSIRPVKLEGTQSGAGSLAGGLLGGVAGGAIGHGYGQVAGAAAGAVAGALLGNVVEQGVTSAEGLEIIVKLSETGKTVAIAQEGKPSEFSVGQRVIILHDNRSGSARVSAVNTTTKHGDAYDDYDYDYKNDDNNYKDSKNYHPSKNHEKYPPSDNF